jgi:hypothetical protein
MAGENDAAEAVEQVADAAATEAAAATANAVVAEVSKKDAEASTTKTAAEAAVALASGAAAAAAMDAAERERTFVTQVSTWQTETNNRIAQLTEENSQLKSGLSLAMERLSLIQVAPPAVVKETTATETIVTPQGEQAPRKGEGESPAAKTRPARRMI